MAWGESYQTAVLEDVGLPTLEGKLLIGEPWSRPEQFVLIAGLDLRSLREQEVWRRLLVERYAGAAWIYYGVFRPTWPPEDFELYQKALPASRYAFCIAFEQPEPFPVHGLDKPERAFAAIVEGNTASLCMVGPPTEEAWDQFSEAITRVFGQ